MLFHLLYTISTAKLFAGDGDPPPDADDDDDWPPFKKVGAFDPYADDPRFVIQKIHICPASKLMAVGGSGGQVILYDFNEGETKEVGVHSLVEVKFLCLCCIRNQ